MNKWKVDLAISGPISTGLTTLSEELSFEVEKGHNQPFMTTVRLKNTPHGILATVIAQADTSDDANDAAVFFIGQMLDFMCLQHDTPLFVSLSGTQFRSLDTNVKRIVEKQEWIEAFNRGREYGKERPAFSRALSWYRKGLTSEDP